MQAIYLAECRTQAETAFRHFRARWRCRVSRLDLIIDFIFQKFNLEWKTPTLKLFTQSA